MTCALIALATTLGTLAAVVLIVVLAARALDEHGEWIG